MAAEGSIPGGPESQNFCLTNLAPSGAAAAFTSRCQYGVVGHTYRCCRANSLGMDLINERVQEDLWMMYLPFVFCDSIWLSPICLVQPERLAVLPGKTAAGSASSLSCPPSCPASLALSPSFYPGLHTHDGLLQEASPPAPLGRFI